MKGKPGLVVLGAATGVPMADMRLVVFDVNHGNCIVVICPNGKHLMFDCGCTDEFSPARHIRYNWQVGQIDYFTVTHPHSDHIYDLANVESLFDLRVLWRPVVSDQQVYAENSRENRALLDRYISFSGRFSGPPPSSEDWGGVSFLRFGLPIDQGYNLNDLSRVSVLAYAGSRVMIPGDIEAKGWQALLQDSNFRSAIVGTTFLVASHHGRDSGFLRELFGYFTPHLTIVSDGRFGDTSATDRYDAVTAGAFVYDRAGNYERRKVVTTRQDGAITVDIGVTGYRVTKWK